MSAIRDLFGIGTKVLHFCLNYYQMTLLLTI